MQEPYKFLCEEDMIEPDDYVVVAVSGGPDSMALLSLLLDIRKKQNFHIVCAHVNHNVRKESVDEAKFVFEFCKEQHVIFETMTINEYHKDNFHQQARNIRYRFFESILKKYHSKILFTAHHGDDLIETNLMRILRGSSLRGYGGFLEYSYRDNYTIVRPLISVTKRDILDYLNEYHIPYVVDSSNDKELYTRNRIRKHILPLLKEESADAHKRFYRFSKKLQEYQNYIDCQVEKEWSVLVQDDKLLLNIWKNVDSVIQKEILRQLLAEVYQEHLNMITDQHIEEIYQLCYSHKGNATLSLPNHIQAIKTYNFLTIARTSEKNGTYSYELLEEGNLLPNGHRIEMISTTTENGNDICRLCKSDLILPLTIRPKKDGEKIEVKGLNGSKKISDIFIDQKIPMKDRKLWPIVVDASGKVVWIPGLKKSNFDRTNGEKCDIILKYH